MTLPNREVEFVNPRAAHEFKGRTCSIQSVGSYVPEKVLTNEDIAKLVDTSDEWITSRTGIRERRIAAEDQHTSHLATNAAMDALKKGNVKPEEVELIIVATITPDMLFPATACLVQQMIGATNAAAFDLEAACSGFIYALEIGQQFIMSRTYNTVLVIGAEKLSTIIDWEDRNSCVLFGDGAGAAILQNRPNSHGLLTAAMGSDGTKGELLCMPAGGSQIPATRESVNNRLHFLRMDGRETFKNAVNAMCIAAKEVLTRCQLDISQIQHIIPHQANKRIIAAVGDRLKATKDQVFVNLDRYGNTSAASVAIALDEAAESGRLKRGDLILIIVFGAGLTWGAAVIEW
ncbi:MAG: 3-oxoacyl-[acyl-carrier-protein] synthase 3 [Verrucomicrobia subdivision 3 bacterium]|nr:3-oxoacyl-[acyl-carrier-protein] synthase 3 [Limisphaerales bacterium]MCS1415489.1 3-oxoacyl-[acyl-carrier-protein] synthase 3 [Limisphaerales bacterium]